MSEADAAVAAATYMPLHVTILEFLAFDYSGVWNKGSPLNKHSPWNIWQKQET